MRAATSTERLCQFWQRQPLQGAVSGLAIILALATPAQADQTINDSFPTSCVAQGGILGASNFISDFDNGTFGTANGQPNQTPALDPYPSKVDGGIYDEFYDINHGDYSYIANITTPRNTFQHPDPANSPGAITDPEYGATGRFFASDPNADTPTLNFDITNVQPNQNYELAFWAVNSELSAIPNVVNAVVDNIVSFSTGDLVAVRAALPWQRYGFVFNAGDRTTIQLSIASTETGAAGRDFYLDNVTMRQCSVPGGTLTGTIFTDVDGNNIYQAGTDGPLNAIAVELWDTGGDSDPANDIYVSVTNSGANGVYSFTNIAPSNSYELRVRTTDPDLPGGATPGTPATLPAVVTSGGTTSGKDFGFDGNLAVLDAEKTMEPHQTGGLNLPGEDVVYTISVSNRGSGPASSGSIFLVDPLPGQVEFYTGDFAAIGSGPIEFTDNGSGLSLGSGDFGYAQSGTAPANLAACNYTPTALYDPAIGYLCVEPTGSMNAGNPDPSFAVRFRTRIK